MKKMFFLILGLLLVMGNVSAQENSSEDLPECLYELAGKTLKFYHFGDLSGPYSQFTLPVVAGFEDAIAYFNA